MDFGDRGIRMWIQLRVKLSRIYLVIFHGWTLHREKISFSDNYSRNTVSAREKYIYISRGVLFESFILKNYNRKGRLISRVEDRWASCRST